MIDLKKHLFTSKLDIAFVTIIATTFCLIVASSVLGPAHENANEHELQQTAETMGAQNDDSVVALTTAASVQSTDDLSKLPRITPQHFQNYLSNRLSQNKPDENGCIDVYAIDKVSEVNIAATINKTNPTAEPQAPDTCGPRARVVWSYVNDTWVEAPYTLTKCQVLIDNGIYGEFIPFCNDGQTYGDQIDNPNGSIKDRKE